MVRGVPVSPEHRIVHRVLVNIDFFDAIGVDRVYVFPDELPACGDFQQMSLCHGADQSIAVRQTLTPRSDMAEETLIALGTILPNNLIGYVSLLFVRIFIFGLPLCVACVRRIDIVARVLPGGIQEAVYFHRVRLAGTIIKILAVVEDQEMALSRQPIVNPLDIM